jgi:DNA repair exonuclease SbcCD ATPase subunit
MHNLNERLSIISVLTKTFSTTGLVAYKIECLVKDLEQLTNEYLVDLSDGRFQISFKISTGDKLNVVITDNGHDIEINALSNGELARVNAATLLAIRKLMQGISSNRINLLILDETVEALDVEGKEKLVEVLLKEEYLNTFLVSHGFQHPLLEKVFVVKTNNVSKVEA